ncbi:MAG: EAL domain-containing protein [Gammaproteobacteria bacterium]|nr:EAL domain-containing protein [Gammaproteobacteria bacterium]
MRWGWLIHLTFLAMVAMVVAAFSVVANRAHEDAEKALYSQALIAGQSVANGLERSIASHFYDIRFLRDSLRVRKTAIPRPDRAARTIFRTFLRTHPAILALAIQNASGRKVLWARGPVGHRQGSFIPVSGKPRESVGPLLAAPQRGAPGMTVLVRERIDGAAGRVLGFVLCRVRLSNLPTLHIGPLLGRVVLAGAKGQALAAWTGHRWRPAPPTGPVAGYAQVALQELPWQVRVQWSGAAVQRAFWSKERPYAAAGAGLVALILLMDALMQIGYARIRQLRRYQEAAVRIQKELMQIEDPEGLYRVVVDVVVGHAGAIGAFVAVPQIASEWLRIAATRASAPDLEKALGALTPCLDGGRFPEGQTLSARCYREGVPVGPEDPRADAAMARLQAVSRALLKVRSMMAYPVFVTESTQPAAVLVIGSGKRNHFPPALRDLLVQVAQSIGIALTQARHHREITQALEWNHTLLQNASDGIHVIDTDGHLVEVSEQFCAMLGDSREALMGKRPTYWDAALSEADIEALIRRQFAEGGPVTFETRHRRRDGTVFDVEVSGRAAVIGGRRVFFNSSRDISERKNLEATLRNHAATVQRIADFNRLLSEANEVINQTRNEQGLLTALCELAVEHAHALLAWVGRPDAEGWFEVAAAAGCVEYLKDIRLSVAADVKEGASLEGVAWRTGRTAYDLALTANPRMAPWADRIREYGIRAAAALPIHRNGALWAVLTVYEGGEYVLDADLQKILRDLAQDIGFGLDRLDIARAEREANALNMALLDSMASGVFVLRYPERHIERYNRRLLEIYGVPSAEELLKRYGREFYPSEEDYERIRLFADQVLQDGAGLLRSVAYRRDDGEIIYTDIAGRLLDAADGVRRIVWTHVDVTERHRQDQSIRALSGERATLLANTTAGIALVRYPERVFVEVNQAFLDILGYRSAQEVVGHPTSEMYPDNTQNQSMANLSRHVISRGHGRLRDLALMSRDGRGVIFVDVSGQRIEAGHGDHPVVVWTSVDVTERHQLAEALAHQAFSDKLTGLPNRRALDEELEKAMARAQRHERLLAVVMMDLDGFKPVNDTYGHEAGDLVLQTLGRRLQAGLRASDFVSRLGGDEFVLLLEDCRSLDEVVRVLEEVGEIVRAPIALAEGQWVELSCSAGVCLYPYDDITNPDGLIRYADRALYESKEHKADRLRFWAVYGEPSPRRLNGVQRRLRENGLIVYYQPILDNRSRRVVGVEALARIGDSDGRILTPGEFLPYLNEDDLLDLTGRVLRASLKDLLHLDGLGRALWVSVNVDPSSVSERLVAQLEAIIAGTAVAPARIVLEILEGSNFLERSTALKHLLDLKALGVRLALDDVGSAYSSLLRLKELPVDEVKLDQGFVRTLEEDPSGILFTATVLDLARDLGKTMVVEGVETEDILDAATVLNVPFLQGYQIARPMPMDELVVFLQDAPLRHRQHPTSLLGVYAQQLVYDRAVRRMIRHDAAVISRLALSDARACRLHGHMKRLGIVEESALWELHADYHRALATMETLALAETGFDWPEVQAAQEAFVQAILAEYRRSRSLIVRP